MSKMTTKTKIKRFFTRLHVAFDILFMGRRHWLFIALQEKDLVKLLKGREFEADVEYHGLRPYLVYRLIQMLDNGIDESEMVLLKAEFEAKALLNKEDN